MKKRVTTACLALGVFAASTLTSCFNSRIYAGSMQASDPVVEVNKEWNHHFIYGLAPGNNAKMTAAEYTKGQKDYMIKTNTSFLNGLVSCVTFGIYTPTTTTYYFPAK